MNTYLLLAVALLITGWYLSFSATRLDRLHHRVETSWSNLDGLLQRRAAIALEIAQTDIADPASAMLLTFAAHQARDASIRDRSQAETSLTGALGILIENSTTIDSDHEIALIAELKDLTSKIAIAIAIHLDAVSRTQMVRRKFLIRALRLAGHAPEPVTYEFEGDVL